MSQESRLSPSSASIGVLCTAAAVVLVLGSNLVDIGRFHDAMTKTQVQQQVNLESASHAENGLRVRVTTVGQRLGAFGERIELIFGAAG